MKKNIEYQTWVKERFIVVTPLLDAVDRHITFCSSDFFLHPYPYTCFL